MSTLASILPSVAVEFEAELPIYVEWR